ncbi:MAG: YggT family protein, partial [Bacteroidia bacterium]
MNPMMEIAYLLTKTFFSFLMLAVILRLLLQIARADFYNPISQFLVKVSNPLLLPLRKIIPPLGKIDSASIVLALAVQVLAIVVLLLIFDARIPNIITLLGWATIGCLAL